MGGGVWIDVALRVQIDDGHHGHEQERRQC